MEMKRLIHTIVLVGALTVAAAILMTFPVTDATAHMPILAMPLVGVAATASGLPAHLPVLDHAAWPQLETKADPEVKSIADIVTLIGAQNTEFRSFTERMNKRLEDEKKEREDLEARINRQGGAGISTGKGDQVAERKALNVFIRTDNDTELKALSVGSDPDGGYHVLPVMSGTFTKRLFDLSPMRRLSRIETITAGDGFEEIDDREEANAVWIGESAARPALDTPKVGKWSVPVHEIYSLQPITQRLLDDANFDLATWIEQKIADKFARSEGTAFVAGDGMLKPKGLLSYPTSDKGDFDRPRGTIQFVKSGNSTGFPAASSSVNPADSLKSLLWALRAPYRTGAVWQMNSNTASMIDKWKNENGDYIWRYGMLAGSPSSLLGYEVAINEDMPNVGAGAYPISFGNMNLAYCIVEKLGIKFLRDPYTAKPNVMFYAYRRVGGGLANDDAVKLLKIGE